MSKDVLDAMGQLITSLLKETQVQAPLPATPASYHPASHLLFSAISPHPPHPPASLGLRPHARPCAVLQPDTVIETSDLKMRELLVWQLVTGYKLRELEVTQELQDKFWGAEVADQL